MRTGPCDVLLLALARPTVNIDTDMTSLLDDSLAVEQMGPKSFMFICYLFFFFC